MPSNRHNLVLDEQAFQGLLSAAFIVQEYNDRQEKNRLKDERLKWARQQQAEPEISPVPKLNSVCGRCGAPKVSEGSECESCGRDAFRPGERLQRNWASMWLMSQEHDLWPARPPETDAGGQDDSAQKDVPEPAVEPRELLATARASASSGLAAERITGDRSGHRSDVIHDTFIGQAANRFPQHNSTMDSKVDMLEGPSGSPASDASALEKPVPHVPEFASHVVSNAVWPREALDHSEVERPSTTAAMDHTTRENSAHEDSNLGGYTYQSSQSSAHDDASPIDTSLDDSGEPFRGDDGGGDGPGNKRSLIQQLADLRVVVHFHRSSLYLIGAVLIAALALLWPVADSPRRSALSPMERVLVAMGLAEAPEPAVRVQGDPTVEVWVDPHTALYYCPGEEQYGKTPDGRFSSQRDAQMDRFEPAGRSTCE